MSKQNLAWIVLAAQIATGIFFLNAGLGFLMNSDSDLLVWLTLPIVVGVGIGNLAIFNNYVKGNL